jgi:nucleoside-diphosphate-sugar epimerase
MRVLIAGCGWLGKALGRTLAARGDLVTGIRRDPAAASGLREVGIEPLALDLSVRESAAKIPGGFDAIVACQAAHDDSIEAYRAAYVEATRNLLDAARRAGVGAFVYTGSTGVFGQRDGGDVDEATPPSPAGASAEVLAEAERVALEGAGAGVPARVVRLSGLYGPGRTGAIDRVRQGVLALGEGDDVWMNWCHLDDAMAAVIAATERGRSGGVYHATDAHPARRSEVVEWIAARLGIPAPRRADHGVPLPSGRRGANRRILGERTRSELGLTLAWPSFREGLAPFLPASPG